MYCHSSMASPYNQFIFAVNTLDIEAMQHSLDHSCAPSPIYSAYRLRWTRTPEPLIRRFVIIHLYKLFI